MMETFKTKIECYKCKGCTRTFYFKIFLGKLRVELKIIFPPDILGYFYENINRRRTNSMLDIMLSEIKKCAENGEIYDKLKFTFHDYWYNNYYDLDLSHVLWKSDEDILWALEFSERLREIYSHPYLLENINNLWDELFYGS